jgi:hypothetical protein
MINFFKKYQIILILAFIAVVLLMVKLLYTGEGEKISIKKLVPSVEEEFTERRDFKFKIYFSTDIGRVWEKMELKVEPELEFRKGLGEEPGVMEVWVVENIEAGTRYNWDVSLNGELIGEWSYKSSDLTEEEKRSRGLGDPERIVEIAKEQYEMYPLLDYMPYSNEDFSLNYLEPLVLIVKIKGVEREAIMEQVKYWIKSKGVDPATHEIEWK